MDVPPAIGPPFETIQTNPIKTSFTASYKMTATSSKEYKTQALRFGPSLSLRQTDTVFTACVQLVSRRVPLDPSDYVLSSEPNPDMPSVLYANVFFSNESAVSLFSVWEILTAHKDL